jgi:tRNA(Ile)-lysidine synthase TilS/MesJ
VRERPLAILDGACVRCGTTENLVRISEFGKAVCEGCFPEFLRRRIEATVRRYRMIPRRAHAVVAVSGGKDSGALLLALAHTRNRLNFTLTAIHLDMGLGEYSEASLAAAQAQASTACVELAVERVQDYGVEVAPIRDWPLCAVCGAVRRALLPKMAVRLRADVLCTGHTLDDQLQYILKNTLSGRPASPPPVLAPRLGFPRKSKPLIETPDIATATYVRLTGLPVVENSCPAFDPTSHRLKEVFDLMERLAPMSKLQYWRTMRKVLEPDEEAGEERPCNVCGEPTWFVTCPLCRLRAEQQGNR